MGSLAFAEGSPEFAVDTPVLPDILGFAANNAVVALHKFAAVAEVELGGDKRDWAGHRVYWTVNRQD